MVNICDTFEDKPWHEYEDKTKYYMDCIRNVFKHFDGMPFTMGTMKSLSEHLILIAEKAKGYDGIDLTKIMYPVRYFDVGLKLTVEIRPDGPVEWRRWEW